MVSEIIDMAAYRRNAQRALSDLHLQWAMVALEQAREILDPYWSAVPVGDVLCTIEDALNRLDEEPEPHQQQDAAVTRSVSIDPSTSPAGTE